MPNLFFRTNITPYRVDTYNAIHERLDCCMYFMYADDSSQAYKMERIEARCHFTPLILEQKKIGRFSYFKDIWKIIRKNDADVVIVPEFKLITIQAIAYKWLFKRKMKVISMCDDSYDMVANGRDFTYKHTLARRLITPLLDDLLITDSKACEWYKKKFGKGIWLPIMRDEKIEEPLYQAAQGISREYEKQFNLKGKKILLYVGRLAEEKNLSTLIKAVAKTSGEFTTVIIGDGPMKDTLMEEARLAGKEFIFPGRFDDDEIRAWFNLGDVFILPSTIEPFGAVTNEALLGGCFALLSKACGSACLIDETNGRLFDPSDPEAMALIIDDTFSNLHDNEGDRPGNRMKISFDDAVVKVIDQLNRQR